MIDACLTIDGRPVGTDETFAVLNPATGAAAGRAPRAGQAELDAAVAAAKRAFPAWSAQDDATLRAACEAVTAKLQEHAEELARVLTLEQGKPLNGLGSRWEMGGAAAWAGYTASLSLPVQVLQDTNEGRVELHRKPLGVVGSITPWNFPVMIAIWHVLPALRTGNTVVLKPSPYTPLATLRMVEILNEVLPAGVLNAVSGDDAGFNIGAAMSSHPDIAKIVFTGSIGTGRHVMRSAAETLKRLTLELGGNDAGIVLPDADPAKIAEVKDLLAYLRLINAFRLDPIAALKSCSWGKFQIMGANFELCGEPDVKELIAKMCGSEATQIGLLASFIRRKPRSWKDPKNKALGKEISLWDAVKTKNWAAIAFNYNGPSYKTYDYDTKLKNAYEKHKKST